MMPPILTAASCDALCGGGGGGAGGLVAFDIATLGLGSNVPIQNNGDPFEAITGLADLVLDASAGDLISVEPSLFIATTNASTTDAFFDVATIVAASPVNWFSGGTGLATNGGVFAWAGVDITTRAISGAAFYEVQAGDIAAGQVTLRLMFRTAGADELVVTAFGTTGDAFVYAQNWGQP